MTNYLGNNWDTLMSDYLKNFGKNEYIDSHTEKGIQMGHNTHQTEPSIFSEISESGESSENYNQIL